MQDSNYWTTVDAAAAYRKYEFSVTPYGLTNAGATFQRMMDMCLAGLAYMDDNIFGKTFAKHLDELDSVFERAYYLRHRNA